MQLSPQRRASAMVAFLRLLLVLVLGLSPAAWAAPIEVAGAAGRTPVPVDPDLDPDTRTLGEAALRAVDPYDNTVWLVDTRNQLVHLDGNGNAGSRTALPARATAIGIALDRSLWIAGEHSVWHLSADASLIATLDPGAAWTQPISAFAVDSLASRIWIAGRDVVGIIDIGNPASAPTVIPIDTWIRGMALDPRSGNIWLLTDSEVAVFDGAGRRVASNTLAALGATDATGLVYDGHHDAFVVSMPSGLRALDRDPSGVTRKVLPAGYNVREAAPFRLLPGISLLRPPEVSSTYEPQPAFALQLSALCNDAPCAVNPGYLETFRLSAFLNGQPVANQFRYDRHTGQSAFMPTAPLPFGANRFSAHATDRFGHASNSVEARLQVNDLKDALVPLKANAAPAVTMTAPLNNAKFATGSNITLSATATDSDGTIAKVEFFRGSTLIGAVTTAPYTYVWTNVPAGSHSLTAKAKDNANASKTSAAVKITVATPPNVPPAVSITSPAGNSTVNGPTVVIAAAASDSDGTVAKVDFYDGTTLLGTVNGGSAMVNATWSYANVAGGAHTLKAVATDSSGATTTSALVAVTVNAAPYAVITSPANCGVFDGPADMAIAADAYDFDGSVARVDFYQGGTLLGSATRAPYRAVWANVQPGNHVLTAIAVDNFGASRPSNPVAISVLGPDAPPEVSITAPADGATVGAGAIVTVTANAADSDGTIKTVEFYAGTTPLGAPVSGSPYKVKWTPVTSGSYTLTAKATDNRDVSTTSAPIHVAVVPDTPPTVAITSPVMGAGFAAGSTVDIAATASDGDGWISKVEFFWGHAGLIPSTLIDVVSSPPYTVPFTLGQAGAYNLMGRATDNLGVSTDSAVVSISAGTPPSVSITSPPDNALISPLATTRYNVRAVPAGDARVASLGATIDMDGVGQVLSFNCTGGLSGTYDCYTDRRYGPGRYTMTGRATDSLGLTANSAPIRFGIVSPPAVQMSSPAHGASFLVPATINLAATATQPDGTVSTVDYYLNGTKVKTGTPPSFAATLTNVASGTHRLSAIATDNFGLTAATAADVVVTVGPVLLDIASPADGALIHTTTVPVTGTYGGATPTSITVNDIQAAYGNGTFSATVPLSPGANGIVVTANTGTTPVTKVIQVTAVNDPPVVSLTSPAPGTSLTLPTSIVLTADASDSDGDIKRVTFMAGVIQVATITAPPYTYTWTNPSAGTYNIVAKAYDDRDAMTSSAPVSVTVTNIPGVRIVSPPDNSVFVAGTGYVVSIYASSVSFAQLSTIELYRNDILFQAANVPAGRSSHTFNVSVQGETEGVVTYSARSVDSVGGVVNSAPIHVTIRPGPTVRLLAPAAGTSLAAPASIQFVADASAAVGSIDRVEFYAGGPTPVATATSSPYVAAWSNVPLGTYSLTAKAVDTLGTVATSTPVEVAVGAASLNILAPVDGESVYDASVTVGGTFGGSGPLQSLTINGVPAATGGGTFAATVPLNSGANTLTAVASIGGTSISRSITVTRENPSITLTGLTSGAVIHDDNVSVQGVVRAPLNSAVFVNGRFADVDPAGNFFVNNVLLNAGMNTITVTLNTQDGPGIQQVLTNVNSDDLQPFTFSVSPDTTFEKRFAATLTLTDLSRVPYARLELAFDGATTYSEASPTEPVPEQTYAMAIDGAGVHTVAVRLFDAQDQVIYSASRTIRIASPGEIDRKIRRVYRTTLDRLLAGSVNSAMTAFILQAQPEYQSLFAELGGDLSSITDSLRNVGSTTYGSTFAEIVVTRLGTDGVHGYPIQLVRDDDGIWRISGM